jgi:membrane associated rhomboid family serine protease
MTDRPSSTLCPSCGSLVGVNDEQCLTCGRRNPGMFGLTAALRGLGEDLGFLNIVTAGCGLLFVASLVVTARLNPDALQGGGLLSFLSPSTPSLFLFGASGALPVYGLGRWWTVLSAGWLHGGLVHIAFNLMSARSLLPAMAHLYGPGRTVLLWTIASVVGFLASSTAGAYLPAIPFLRGAGITIGASASIFGLIGALFHYGGQASAHIKEVATRWAVSGALGPPRRLRRRLPRLEMAQPLHPRAGQPRAGGRSVPGRVPPGGGGLGGDRGEAPAVERPRRDLP